MDGGGCCGVGGGGCCGVCGDVMWWVLLCGCYLRWCCYGVVILRCGCCGVIWWIPCDGEVMWCCYTVGVGV